MDIRKDMGAVVGAAIRVLIARGEVPDDVVLVPAPTRRINARLRGGDPVTDMCQASGFHVYQCLEHARNIKDSVGLSAAERRANLTSGVRYFGSRTIPKNVLVIDDVVTTGATGEASASVLRSAGMQVTGLLVVCSA